VVHGKVNSKPSLCSLPTFLNWLLIFLVVELPLLPRRTQSQPSPIPCSPHYWKWGDNKADQQRHPSAEDSPLTVQTRPYPASPSLRVGCAVSRVAGAQYTALPAHTSLQLLVPSLWGSRRVGKAVQGAEGTSHHPICLYSPHPNLSPHRGLKGCSTNCICEEFTSL
jgi:hypothetical protein